MSYHDDLSRFWWGMVGVTLLFVGLYKLAGVLAEKPEPLPVAEPIVISAAPLSSFDMSVQRDTLIARYAKTQDVVPLWLALSVSHAETWSGDSAVTNARTGATGLFQIHPVNFGRFPHCGEPIVNRQVNICYGFEILVECIEAGNESLSTMLACYGGATRASTRRMYVDAVAKRVRVEWLNGDST